MKIWKISIDWENYAQMCFADDVPRQIEKSLDGTPQKEEWDPVSVEIIDKFMKRPLGDASGFAYGLLLVNEKALKILENLISDSVEILKMKTPEANRYCIHVLKTLDVFDAENAVAYYFNDGRIMECKRYSFIETDELKNAIIFRIPNEPSANAFVTERFVKTVEDSQLTGFKFELVWDNSLSDDEPQKDTNVSIPNTDIEDTAEMKKIVLRLKNEKGDKFWKCETDDRYLMVNQGKWGYYGKYDLYSFENEEVCRDKYDSLITLKKKQGYAETDEFNEEDHRYFSCDDDALNRLSAHPLFRRYCKNDIYYEREKAYLLLGSPEAVEVMKKSRTA